MYGDKYDDIFPPIHKFGPVTVTVLEESDEQGCFAGGDLAEDDCKTTSTGSAALACVYLMVGANIMLTYIYSIHWHLSLINNLHIFLCSSGFQLLIPMGILMQCKLNGPSKSLTQEERTNQHMVLQITGSLIGVTGAVCIVISGETTEDNKWSFHCISGIVSCAFVLLSLITGLAAKMHANCVTKHPVYGLAAYISSSICFVLGIIKNDFVAFVPMSMAPDVLYMVIGLCGVTTLIVIYFPVRHILARRLCN